MVDLTTREPLGEDLLGGALHRLRPGGATRQRDDDPGDEPQKTSMEMLIMTQPPQPHPSPQNIMIASLSAHIGIVGVGRPVEPGPFGPSARCDR